MTMLFTIVGIKALVAGNRNSRKISFYTLHIHVCTL